MASVNGRRPKGVVDRSGCIIFTFAKGKENLLAETTLKTLD